MVEVPIVPKSILGVKRKSVEVLGRIGKRKKKLGRPKGSKNMPKCARALKQKLQGKKSKKWRLHDSDRDVHAPDEKENCGDTETEQMELPKDDGVVGDAGVYVENQCSDKITQLTDNVYVCRSGSAADSQVVSDYVRHFLHQHTFQLWQPATVKVVANLIKLLSYGNKNMLQTGLIVGGWDKYEGGKIYGVPLGGTVIKVPFAIGGSGYSYLYGFFDQAWREGMTKDEAEKLILTLLSLL
ncbi:proteasome subunit beta type-6-like [Rosa rugosa]|uniref:proteasome subunit beta type-6-like n=1 Tax=Rosa rugosa TaxID=74645 RepID=UPI002B4116EA|nr:proteasome subunit beta type-6-like [Rosa rugosa]